MSEKILKPLRPTISFFHPYELEPIVEDACRVLAAGPGVVVENEEGRRLLEEAGAHPHGTRHRIPESLVRRCLETAPSHFTVFDRDGEPALDLGGDSVAFDPGSAAINILDSEGCRRAGTCADVIDLVRLVNMLPGYAAQATALTPGDVPEELGDRIRLYLALKYGRKPIITGTFRIDGFAPMRDMLLAIRGDETSLAEKPLAIFDCCPSPPLRWSELTCQALIDCSRTMIPVEFVSMPLAGATAPVTLRESIVQHCAECLSGVVLTQLARKGAPVIYGGAPAAFDMRQGTTPMGAIETMMICAGYSQVGKHLGLPTHGYLALSEAKTPDYQAGMETAIGAFMAALSGINIVSGPGLLDYLLTQSLEKLVLDHEACSMALRCIRGVAHHKTDITTLFTELVATGEFLSHDHTRKHWRSELSIASPVVDRQTFGDWEKSGAKSAWERARDEVRRLLGKAQDPPLEKTVALELDAIIEREAARIGWKQLSTTQSTHNGRGDRDRRESSS